jgi:ketosteroid isomerase-like protein
LALPVVPKSPLQEADGHLELNPSNHLMKADQNSLHIMGTAGNAMWSNGEWSLSIQEKTGDPMLLKGYWSEIYLREGDAWKVRMQTFNITPAPAATPSPTVSPSSR